MFFLSCSHFPVVFSFVSPFTEVLQEIRRDITRKFGKTLNRSLVNAFGVKASPASPRLRRAKEALKWQIRTNRGLPVFVRRLSDYGGQAADQTDEDCRGSRIGCFRKSEGGTPAATVLFGRRETTLVSKCGPPREDTRYLVIVVRCSSSVRISSLVGRTRIDL